MSEPKPGGIQGRIHATILCGMLCALEIRGYLLVRAGKSLLDIPRSWMIAFGAFCLWTCWKTLNREYKKRGFPSALVMATFEGFGIYGLREFLLGIAGHKILEPPPEAHMVSYAALAAFLPWCFYAGRIGRKTRLGMSDRLACLIFAVFFATKIGMAFVSGHDAIVLKGLGCIAVGTGTFLMILGLMDAFSPEGPEFPAIPEPLSGQLSPASKSRSMNGEEPRLQERPLGLR